MKNHHQKSVVFDFGGVLFNTSATEMYRELFARDGRSAEDLDHFLKTVFTKAARSAANTGTMAAVTAPLARQHPEWAGYIEAFNADRDFIRQVRGMVPGMEEVLNAIAARGHKIYGLTNWAADTFESLRAAYPTQTGVFNDIVVSGAVGMKKPGAQIFQLAQQRFGNPDPRRIYYFDDKARNVKAAQQTVGWNGVVFEDAGTVKRMLGL